MLQTIIGAIKGRKVLSLSYKGISRKVEPHAVGVSTAGKTIMRCYQVRGAHEKPGHDWDLLDVSKIEHLSMTGDNFPNARSGYTRGDKAMTTIYAEL